jgi:hypothetical protein
MIVYRLFVGVAAAVLLVVLYFFVTGLADGTVSSRNITMWLPLVGGVTAIMTGGLVLDVRGMRGAATAVLAILAIPGIVAGLLILALIVFQPRWN